MSSLIDLLDALPEKAKKNVSLLDALPDVKEQITSVDYETKPSLLESDSIAMSAAERFAVLMHSKEKDEEEGPLPNKKKRRSSNPLPISKKKKEKLTRGKQIKARARGNQRVFKKG